MAGYGQAFKYKMDAIGGSKPLHSSSEQELQKLRQENHELHQKMLDAEADKNFTESLWKHFMVEHGDISQAIDRVMQREKQLREQEVGPLKEALRSKSDEFDRLEANVSKTQAEFFQLQSRSEHLNERTRRLEEEKLDHQAALQAARNTISELEKRNTENASRQAVRELDHSNMELKQKISRLEREAERTTRENEDLKVSKDDYRDRVKRLEDNLKESGEKYDELYKENNELRKKSRRSEPEMKSVKRELQEKNKELEALRKELSVLWENHTQSQQHGAEQASLIRQLKALQQDTQTALKNQEEAFNLEKRTMEQKLKVQESIICNQQLGEEAHRGDDEDDVDSHIRDLRSEVETLRSRIDSTRRPSTHDRSVSPMSLSSPYLSRISPRPSRSTQRSRSQPLRSRSERSGSGSRSQLRQRARSKSPDVGASRAKMDLSDDMLPAKKLTAMQRSLEESQATLHFKNVELEETRAAHRRRLERLKALQSSYKMLKEQHRILEEEAYGNRNRKRKVPRPPPKSLQKESSDTVWNELAYHKKEHKNLQVEKMNLEEVVDKLRVQAAHDAASIHELQLELKQEKEEVLSLSEELAAVCPGSDEQLESMSVQLEKALHKLQAEIQHRQKAEHDKDKASEARRAAISDLNTQQHEVAELRVKVANLSNDNRRLHKELSKRKKHAAHSRRTHLAKKYQKSLNNSVQQLSDMLGKEFVDEEQVWEDVSETLESEQQEETTITNSTLHTTETEAEADNSETSLGTAIMQRAREGTSNEQRRRSSRSRSPTRSVVIEPSQRTAESMAGHVSRILRNKNEMPTREYEEYQSPDRRDVALSPIHFKAQSSPPAATARCNSKSSLTSSSAAARQTAALKQRVTKLTQQVNILKIVKNNLSQEAAESKKMAKELDNELTTVHNKLDTARNTIQRLSNDLDRLRDEKEELEEHMSGSAPGENISVNTQQDWITLNNRLRSTAGEMSRHIAQCKQLRAENAQQADKIEQLNDRLNHQERDIYQKRTLIDDLRNKMRQIQDKSAAEEGDKEELSTKLKKCEDVQRSLKVQLESQRARLQVISKEKQSREEDIRSLSGQLDKKNKQVEEWRCRYGEVQGRLSGQEEQMKKIMRNSEAAIDTMAEQVKQQTRLASEYSKFVRQLGEILISSLQQHRSFLQQRQRLQQQQQEKHQRQKAEKENKLDPVYRAHACKVMNITETYLDEILSNHSRADESTTMSETSDDGDEETRRYNKWKGKCHKQMKTKEFALELANLFMEKIHEHSQLASELATTK